MRFGLVHRIMTDALAALGILAIVSTGAMTPWANVIVIVGMVLALAVPEGWQPKNGMRQFATFAPALLIVVQIARFFMGRSVLDIVVEFAAILQVLRLSTRRGAQHDQQIIVLALLHFVAGTVLGGGISYGLCFLGFLIMAPGALVLSHLRREVEGNYRQGARDRTGLPVDVPRILRSRRVVGRSFLAATCLLAVPIFLFTAALFVCFPRVGLSLLFIPHSHDEKIIGFSDRVDFNDIGALRAGPNTSLALRFTVSGLPDPPPDKYVMRFRGTALDTYGQRQWSHATPERKGPNYDDTMVFARRPKDSDRKFFIDLEPIDPPVVFLPPHTVQIWARKPTQNAIGEPFALVHGQEGEIRYTGGEARGLHYEATVASEREIFTEPLPTMDRGRYLELPPGFPERIATLAHQWTDGQPNDFAKAHAIEEHLRKDFKYDIARLSNGKTEPIDDFLFVTKSGHCEYFSTSMAMMLRSIGIPSRNVMGLVGGTYNRFGRYYAVRQNDAHSWVEAYLDDAHAWVMFDPTPTAPNTQTQEATYVYLRDFVEALAQRWNRYVVGFDIGTQHGLFESVMRSYSRFRKSTHTDHGTAELVTRPKVLLIAFVALFIAVYMLWNRRGRNKARDVKNPGERDKDAIRLEAVASLYRSLENAMAVHGLGRPVALPPLRHAEHIQAAAHPLAGEVVSLTESYLELRFGGRTLTETVKRDFEKRVREIKSKKLVPAVAD